MSVLEAIVLGVVQGLTEFLPISSSGHLRVVPAFLGWEDPGAAFTAVIQMGTMAAVLIYFRTELVAVAREWVRGIRKQQQTTEQRYEARLGWYLLWGTIPIVVLGLVFSDTIETGVRSLYLIGTTLIVLGILLGLVDHFAKHLRNLRSLKPFEALAIGFAQAAALVPGVSRSGATITAGLALGFKREQAARFSFLLSVPAVVISGAYEFVKYFDEFVHGGQIGATIVATIASFVVGYASIAFLLNWLGKHSMAIFVIYRIALGVLVLVLASSGTIS
jgi:undecaprenyl-diphosphatase